MALFPRYAIYFVPAPDSPVYRFGASLLGYDAFEGDARPFPDAATRLAPDWHDLTHDPRKYGFHATLKAPFALAEGRGESELITVCGAFAGSPRPLPAIVPVIRALGDFVALVPAEPSDVLNTLAQDCVETFDGFRAPLTEADRARRNPAALSPRQLENLDRWGYHLVGEDFRFHMTLTGRVPADRRAAIVAMLTEQFATCDDETGAAPAALAIDRIALLRQDDADARFRVVMHLPLQARDVAAD